MLMLAAAAERCLILISASFILLAAEGRGGRFTQQIAWLLTRHLLHSLGAASAPARSGRSVGGPTLPSRLSPRSVLQFPGFFPLQLVFRSVPGRGVGALEPLHVHLSGGVAPRALFTPNHIIEAPTPTQVTHRSPVEPQLGDIS